VVDSPIITKLILTEEIKQQIAALRQHSYNLRFNSQVTADGLSWNLHDDDSFHFGALVGDRLVSTVRLTRVATAVRFESMLQFPATDPFSTIPCFVLSRAATAESHQGNALNMKLRAEVFRYLADLNQPDLFLYGAALSNSKRLLFLEELGYEILVHDKQWQGYLASTESKPTVFKISLSRLPAAIEILESSID
jgi:hypothetical protein